MSDETEPEWLDEQELRAWLNIAELVTSLPGALDAGMQRQAGITFYDYMVMAVLSEQPEYTLQLRDLAEATAGSQSRLSHVLTRLERHGWVWRRRSPDNPRARHATLTEEGRAKIRSAAPAHVAHVRDLIFNGLDATQVRALGELTEPIVARLRTPGSPSPPGDGRPQ